MNIQNVESVIEIVGRWNPADVAYIHSLSYSAEASKESAELQLGCVLERRDCSSNGWPSESNPRFAVDITFGRVSNLSIKDFGDGETQIMGFDIIDLSDRGWEHHNFEVVDYEGRRLHFYCMTIRITNVSSI